MSITFTKLFSSITESTIWCEDSDIRVVWITMLAMSDKNGRIWASIPGLAKRAAVSIDQTETALNKFLSPDPYSRTKEHEGRRIEVIDGGWRLLNHAKYRAIRDEEERKAYKRDWIKNKREEEKQQNVDNVDRSRPQYTHTDTDTEADTKDQKKDTSRRFTPPSLKEIEQHCQEKNYSVDPTAFINFYQSNGWKVGKNKMKCWKSALTTWQQRESKDPAKQDVKISHPSHKEWGGR